MTQELTESISVIRGALLRFIPAPTLCVLEQADAGTPSDAAPLEISGGAGALEGAEVVSALQTYVDEQGSVPRRITIAGGPSIIVGSTLSPAGEREREMFLTPEECSGRDAVVRGRVAVVTGGAQGFGEEITRSLVANGARVIIVDLNLEGAQKLSAEINAEAGPVTGAIRADISDEASVSQMMQQVVALAGGLDLFVSNAGVLKAGSVKELSGKDFEFVTRVNYTGFFLCSKLASRVMSAQNQAAPTERYADIVQINSKSGLSGSNKNGAYAGSKFGGLGLVQSFALELVTDRIKVNAICPGNFFEGPLWSDPDRGLFVQYLRAGKVPGAESVADVKAHYEARVPMGRGCRGEDVARALLYIVEQRYETGQAVPVTGGQIMLA